MSSAMIFLATALAGCAWLLFRVLRRSDSRLATAAAAFATYNLLMIVLLLEVMPRGFERNAILLLLSAACLSFALLEVNLTRRRQD